MSKLTPAEDLILTLFGGWLAAHTDSDEKARGIADLLERFETELPENWREWTEEQRLPREGGAE